MIWLSTNSLIGLNKGQIHVIKGRSVCFWVYKELHSFGNYKERRSLEGDLILTREVPSNRISDVAGRHNKKIRNNIRLEEITLSSFRTVWINKWASIQQIRGKTRSPGCMAIGDSSLTSEDIFSRWMKLLKVSWSIRMFVNIADFPTMKSGSQSTANWKFLSGNSPTAPSLTPTVLTCVIIQSACCGFFYFIAFPPINMAPSSASAYPFVLACYWPLKINKPMNVRPPDWPTSGQFEGKWRGVNGHLLGNVILLSCKMT